MFPKKDNIEKSLVSFFFIPSAFFFLDSLPQPFTTKKKKNSLLSLRNFFFCTSVFLKEPQLDIRISIGRYTANKNVHIKVPITSAIYSCLFLSLFFPVSKFFFKENFRIKPSIHFLLVVFSLWISVLSFSLFSHFFFGFFPVFLFKCREQI